MHEVSREVTLKAKEEGIEQLFLTAPLLFSDNALGRQGTDNIIEATETAEESTVFFDRGIPDVFAYMDYSNTCLSLQSFQR